MTTILMNGKAIAADIKNEVMAQVKELKRPPQLAVILVGEDPASHVYVNKKRKACEECGIESTTCYLPDKVTTEEIVETVKRFNNRPEVSGILVQLPLPPHIDKFVVLNEINPAKDVDCFTSTNMGLLMQNRAILEPCTPQAVIEMLKRYQIPIVGRTITIINDSIVIGRPLSLMLLNAGATPLICNKHTQNLEQICKESDIVVVAVGKRPEFVFTKDFCKKNAVIIDVGINKLNRVVGDVDIDSVFGIAGALTKTPYGVGPVTCSVLMRNTLLAARNQV